MINVLRVYAIKVFKDTSGRIIVSFPPGDYTSLATPLSRLFPDYPRPRLGRRLGLLLAVNLRGTSRKIRDAALLTLRTTDAVPPIEIDRDRIKIHRHEAARVPRILTTNLPQANGQADHTAQRANPNLHASMCAMVLDQRDRREVLLPLRNRTSDVIVETQGTIRVSGFVMPAPVGDSIRMEQAWNNGDTKNRERALSAEPQKPGRHPESFAILRKR